MLRVKQDLDKACYSLTFNFRGHQSVWQLANDLFYDGKMRPGGDQTKFQRTALAGTMTPFFEGGELQAAYRTSDKALAYGNGQCFFHVEREDNSVFLIPGISNEGRSGRN